MDRAPSGSDPSVAPAPLLSARGLRVTLATSRGPADALRGVDLTIGRGETLGLIGESGSGKSMTALALMGLLPAGASVQGSLVFDGEEWVGRDEAAFCHLRGDRIGMVFQEPMTALNPLHPIGRQVAEPLRIHRRLGQAEARREALELLERVRLPQAAQRLDTFPHQLSGGQRQRVGIAIALACRPSLLIADEPTTALDVTIQREILELIGELVADSGMALLLISHDLGVMAKVTARLAVMYGGTIVETGPTAAIAARPAHPYTRGLYAARPRLGRRLPDGARPRLATIEGRVPELSDWPVGCPFANRCAWAIEACRAALPAPVPVGPGHTARCIRIGEIAAMDAR